MNATKKLVLTAIAGSVLTMSYDAIAGSLPGAIGATATVPQVCTIDSTATLPTISFDPIGANASTNATSSVAFNFRCTNGSTGVTIGMNNGLNYAAAGSTSNALQDSAGDFLYYSLYKTGPNLTTSPWGNSGATLFSPSTAQLNGVSQSQTVWAVVPAGGVNALAKVSTSYSDSVTMTINY